MSGSGVEKGQACGLREPVASFGDAPIFLEQGRCGVPVFVMHYTAERARLICLPTPPLPTLSV